MFIFIFTGYLGTLTCVFIFLIIYQCEKYRCLYFFLIGFINLFMIFAVWAIVRKIKNDVKNYNNVQNAIEHISRCVNYIKYEQALSDVGLRSLVTYY